MEATDSNNQFYLHSDHFAENQSHKTIWGFIILNSIVY